MKIGDAAKTLDITVQAIRFYEREGLIRIRRNAAGTRYFNAEDLQRLKVIRDLSGLAIPLGALKDLANVREHSKTGDEASHRVNEKLESMISRLMQYRDAIDTAVSEIESSRQLIHNCYECPVRPTRSNCNQCPVSSQLNQSDINQLIWDQDNEQSS